MLAREVFATRLYALHRDRHGHVVNEQVAEFLPQRGYDLGSGLVTNVGVQAMANDAFWAAPAGASVATLAIQNYHASGTGSTAATVNDIVLQTPAAPTTTTAVVGIQANASGASSAIYRSTGTVNYGGSLAITEWGLHSAAALSVATGSPFTTTSATSATVTGSPYTASSATVRGQQQLVVVPAVTAVWGLILSNSVAVLTVPAWYNRSNGNVGSTPGGTEAFTLIPVLWDHKVFGPLNVESGDSIAWEYELTISSGG